MFAVPHTRRNRLGDEPSLYLRQHSTNPVDWYPWCEAALDRARREDLPILLSVGYSACHWCHVMERECFEDEGIAALMNDNFVCVKVDREERPDIDAAFMRAVQALTGRGGWPMTVFLTPDLQAFYAGTYFPPVDRGGLPGFPRVLRSVAAAYRSEGDRVRRNAELVARAIRTEVASESAAIDRAALLVAGTQLARAMDSEFGGFGTAPKFPGATCLGFQLDLALLSTNVEHRRLIVKALDAMASGGIYDQLGGGFHRYSVDRAWRVPHFEKMLYDQALMVDLYRDAWLVFRDDRYRDVALGTLEFVRREMRSADGAFFSSQDADSDGCEGRYFTWSAEEIRAALGPHDGEIALAYFGVTEAGNFRGENVLYIHAPIDAIARDFGLAAKDVEISIERVERELLALRALRVPPVTDRKILTDWNGLMIRAMAMSGRVFQRPDLVAAACEAADQVLALLWRDSRLFHFHDERVTRVEAFLDDYVFLGRALLELYAVTCRPGYFEAAQRFADILLERYEDKRNGGFYFTPHGLNTLLHREKPLQDGAVPSGNSVAVDFLCRLHALTGDGRYQAAADRAVVAASASALRSPYYGAGLLDAAVRRTLGYTTLVILGSTGTSALLRSALDSYSPGLTVLAPGDGDTTEAGHAPLLRALSAAERGLETAYVCRSGACGLPLHTSSELREALREVVACDV